MARREKPSDTPPARRGRPPAAAAPPPPDLSFERGLACEVGGTVAGIDEAGRAPLAGPVTAAAAVLPAGAGDEPRLAGIADSKLLSAEQRERLFPEILALAQVGVGAASAAEIDRINIHNATLLAMCRAVAALPAAPGAALVDGRTAPPLACPVRTVVGGDRRCLSVAAASIVAKVVRDRLMTRLAARYPGYGWETNKGYGTEVHALALLRLGPTPHHRLTFAPLPEIAQRPGLGVRFVACTGPVRVGSLTLVRLREDLYLACDARSRHVGTLKRTATRWLFRAVGYAADGTPEAGGGPLADRDGRSVDAPAEAALRLALSRRRRG